jgi:hypothetical protein
MAYCQVILLLFSHLSYKRAGLSLSSSETLQIYDSAWTHDDTLLFQKPLLFLKPLSLQRNMASRAHHSVPGKMMAPAASVKDTGYLPGRFGIPGPGSDLTIGGHKALGDLTDNADYSLGQRIHKTSLLPL